MPFIDSKVSVKTTPEQREELKTKLGQAISLIPGKSENWLMINLADEQNMYFKGNGQEPTAFVSVSVYGQPDRSAFQKLTAELTKIYREILGISPDRMYVKYATTQDWGWNGNNF